MIEGQDYCTAGEKGGLQEEKERRENGEENTVFGKTHEVTFLHNPSHLWSQQRCATKWRLDLHSDRARKKAQNFNVLLRHTKIGTTANR